MPSHAPPTASPLPANLRTNLILVGILLLQISLPLAYYLGGGGYDERFAWRMFSAQQEMNQRDGVQIICHELVSEDSGEVWKSVAVSGETLATWQVAMQRRQPVIIRRYLEWRARTSPAKQTRLRIVADHNGELVDRETWLVDHATANITRWENPQ